MDYFNFIRQASRDQLCALLCNMGADPGCMRQISSMGEPYRRKVMDFLSSEAPEDDPIPTAEEMFKEMGYTLQEGTRDVMPYKGSYIVSRYSFTFVRWDGRTIAVTSKGTYSSSPGGQLTDEESAAIDVLREEMKPHA